MLGQILVTKQTGPQGKIVSKVRLIFDFTKTFIFSYTISLVVMGTYIHSSTVDLMGLGSST